MYSEMICKAYACDVRLPGFNADTRFFFDSLEKRNAFLELIRTQTKTKNRRGPSMPVTKYDLECTFANVRFYFGELIADTVSRS